MNAKKMRFDIGLVIVKNSIRAIEWGGLLLMPEQLSSPLPQRMWSDRYTKEEEFVSPKWGSTADDIGMALRHGAMMVLGLDGWSISEICTNPYVASQCCLHHEWYKQDPASQFVERVAISQFVKSVLASGNPDLISQTWLKMNCKVEDKTTLLYHLPFVVGGNVISDTVPDGTWYAVDVLRRNTNLPQPMIKQVVRDMLSLDTAGWVALRLLRICAGELRSACMGHVLKLSDGNPDLAVETIVACLNDLDDSQLDRLLSGIKDASLDSLIDLWNYVGNTLPCQKRTMVIDALIERGYAHEIWGRYDEDEDETRGVVAQYFVQAEAPEACVLAFEDGYRDAHVPGLLDVILRGEPHVKLRAFNACDTYEEAFVPLAESLGLRLPRGVWH